MADLVLRIDGDSRGAQQAVSQTITGLNNIEKSAKRVAFLASAGAAISLVKSAASFIQQQVDAIQETGDLVAEFSASSDRLQDLQAAFVASGGAAADAAEFIRTFARNLSHAESGGKFANAVERLGLSLEDLKRQSPVDSFRQIVAQVQQIGDPIERARAATDLLGRSGQRALSLISMGVSGIDAAGARVPKLTPGEIARGSQASGDIRTAVLALSRTTEKFFAAISPLLSRLTDVVIGAADIVSKSAEALSPVADKISEFLQEINKNIWQPVLDNARGIGEAFADWLGLPRIAGAGNGKINKLGGPPGPNDASQLIGLGRPTAAGAVFGSPEVVRSAFSRQSDWLAKIAAKLDGIEAAVHGVKAAVEDDRDEEVHL